jgi:uncharacterized repeat protein (TIGR01451 family)/LPXTG-motif cell wall-anchored protein
MKQLSKYLTIVAIMLTLSAGQVLAADISVTCDQTGPCDMTPSAGAALFDESEFPNYDLKPGDTVTRKITATNQGDETCFFSLSSATINTENPAGFSQELHTSIRTTGGDVFGTTLNNQATNDKSLYDLLTNGLLGLGVLNSGESLDFDWLVSFDKTAGNEWQKARVEFDFDMYFSCNGVSEADLTISKTNNHLSDTLSPGDEVLYTLYITDNLNPINNVYVLDLAPEGFTYRPGSWTANSSIRGDLKGLGTTTEPTYASPGTWYLGNMTPGEVVTLTYIADISSNQESGLYPDLAYAYGTFDGDIIFANDDVGYYVGTQIAIDVPANPVSQFGGGGAVLGASTELPGTGAHTMWLILAGILITVGISLKIVTRKRSTT